MEDKEIMFTFEDVDNELDFSEAPEEKEEAILKSDTNTKGKTKAKAKEGVKEEVKEDTTERDNEYLTIYDAIMFEDKYQKVYKLGSKYTATFSTRSTDADMKISRQLDGLDFSTMHALQTMSVVLTMSHSLTHLNSTDLTQMDSAERYKFIRSKSSHLVELLSKHMIQFDALVRDALEYGEANF